jgi:hypothetical protein
MLLNQTGFKFSLTVSWDVDLHISDTGVHCLLRETITAVFGLLVAIVIPGVSQLIIQLCFKAALQALGASFLS